MTSYLEKQWNSILNQSNIEWWNRKNNFNYIKEIKKLQLKNEDQNKFYIWLKGEIEKKNQFSKRM
jgi:hypothetical protein